MAETERFEHITADADILLKVCGVTKVFGPVVALNNVDLTLRKGDVLGLIGENGSGKSTITSIVAGMQKATKSEGIFYKGKEWKPDSMIDALNNGEKGCNGIGMIVQESGTIAGISVAENIFLGETDQFRMFKTKSGKTYGPMNRKKLYAAADSALQKAGIKNIRGNMRMASLDFQSKKLVEIAKVVLKDPDVLIVDETSTALAQDGRQILYNIINSYRGTDKAVIFISHDLDEIMSVCDTLTVLRDGNIIRTFEKSEYNADEIRKAMIGREMQGDYYRSDFEPTYSEEVVLEADGLNLGDCLKDVGLQLHRGEILGVGGLAQCGMHELGKVLFGALTLQSGKVIVHDKSGDTGIKRESIAIKHAMGYVSKDRDVESLNLSASIRDNIAIAGMSKFAIGKVFIFGGREKKYVDGQIESLSIKCSDRNQLVQQLSGGNKQKVVFGKWIGCGSEVLILDCPTRGVDIGVKQAMYRLMMQLKGEGKAILLISEEMPELLGMSDRILIMKDGSVQKEFLRSKELSDADIISYMI